MSEIEGQNMSDLYKGSIEINNNTPKGIVPDKDNISTLNSFTSFPLENAASISQTTKENHSDIPEQLPFIENNPNMMTKISQSEQITYNAKFSSSLQQKEISVGEQQEIDDTTSIQPTSKYEINSDTIQNVSNFEGVVETPLNSFNPDLVMQNQTEMLLPNSNINIDNNLLTQASIEQSSEPSLKKEPSLKQELSIEQQTSTESQLSNDKTSPNIGVNYQNNAINLLPYIKMENNHNMETDDNFNSKENNDNNIKPLRAKAADLFNVPNAHLSSENSYQDENNKNEGNLLGEFGQIPQLSNVQSPTIEGNIYQNEIEQNAQLNINQTNREPRRWRNHRSPNSSQFENEKSDHKGSLNLRKISDAEFQALPSGSRLFLGNLSTHSTSRKELFDIFSPYGEILQISIKNSFGFVQYDNVESVKKAIEKENGRVLHGLKLGLEISYSKPWNHSPAQEEGGFKSGTVHRHKKHWNQRGGHKNVWHQNEREFSSSTSRGHHGQSFPNRRHNEYERRPNDPKFGRRTSYDSRSGYDYPDHKEFRSPQEFREDFKEEHDYRPREERGFRRGSYREQHREERFKHRSKPYKIPSRDFNNERRQSREYPYRSQSHDEPNEEFPLPRRQGSDVPECQIIVLEEVERNFLWQVEKAFRDASSTVHILHLSRKLHPQSVIRQMVIEGVHAVVFIEKHLALNGRVNMQIFDQTRSRDNVKYDEYNNIKVEEAVGFLLRARVSQRPVEIRTDNNLLGQQNMQQVPQLPSLTGQPVSTNINPISLNNVNFAALANLLGSLQQQQQSAPASAPAQGIQPIPMIPQAGGIQPSQQPNLLSQQQPSNIDVQQLLRQLAPQNSGLQNQNPFMSMPQQLAPNLASPQSHFNTAAMMNQPPNILSQNAISSGGIPLSQHQAPHINSNVSQFSTPISAPANVTDLMAQLKQYSNQR